MASLWSWGIRLVVVASLSGAAAFGALVFLPMNAGAATDGAAKTCNAAASAAAHLRRGIEVADKTAFERGGRKFRTIERGADELPSDLAAQLHLVVRTLADPPKVATVRAARLYRARLTHGLTGIMLACDRAGVRVVIEY